MNPGSWIVLGIVIAVLALAIRATFFKKNDSCCGGAHEDVDPNGNPNCSGCTSCQGCASQKNCLHPTIKPL